MASHETPSANLFGPGDAICAGLVAYPRWRLMAFARQRLGLVVR
jgi:hypothetical protein